jgi:hypothetical protein
MKKYKKAKEVKEISAEKCVEFIPKQDIPLWQEAVRKAMNEQDISSPEAKYGENVPIH